MRERTRTETGAVAILAATVGVVLLVLCAFVVELGLARDTRRQAQNSADASALAAALRLYPVGSCASGNEPCFDDAVQAVKDYALRNYGVGTSAWPACTDPGRPSEYTYVVPGETSCISFDSATTPSQVRVRIPHRDVTFAFGRLAGVSSVAIGATAEALVTKPPSASLPALFAGSASCADKTFEWSGSGSTVTGAVHSNDEIKFGGTNQVVGNGTYVDTAKDPDKVTWVPNAGNPKKVSHVPLINGVPWHQLHTIGTFKTIGSRPAANYRSSSSTIDFAWFVSNGRWDAATNTITSGVYYSAAGIDLSSFPAGTRGTVTLASAGQIKVSNSDLDLDPFESGLLLYSDHHESGKCDTFGVDISGSDLDWNGLVYAPRSQAKYQGSTGSTLFGSIIANTLYVSGSNFTLSSTGGGSTAPAQISLLR